MLLLSSSSSNRLVIITIIILLNNLNNYFSNAIEDCTTDENAILITYYNDITAKLNACSEDINVPIPDLYCLEVPDFTPLEQVSFCESEVCNILVDIDIVSLPLCNFLGVNVKEFSFEVYDTLFGPCTPSEAPTVTPTAPPPTGSGSGSAAATTTTGTGSGTIFTTILTSIFISIFFGLEFGIVI